MEAPTTFTQACRLGHQPSIGVAVLAKGAAQFELDHGLGGQSFESEGLVRGQARRTRREINNAQHADRLAFLGGQQGSGGVKAEAFAAHHHRLGRRSGIGAGVDDGCEHAVADDLRANGLIAWKVPGSGAVSAGGPATVLADEVDLGRRRAASLRREPGQGVEADVGLQIDGVERRKRVEARGIAPG